MFRTYRKYILGGIIVLAGGIVPAVAVSDNKLPPPLKSPYIRVVTGGYEAMAADKAKRAISGPRTDAVKAFLNSRCVGFDIETMLWSRAHNIVKNTGDILIYPLTRTKERETHFEWVKKIDEHHFNLLSHVSVDANNLSKPEIISGKYYAVCETTTSNCHMLLNYGFPEENIFRISGVDVDGIVMRLAVGRASFMMENYDIVSNIVTRIPSLEGKIEQVKNVTVIMEDYLAASRLSSPFKTHLLDTP